MTKPTADELAAVDPARLTMTQLFEMCARNHLAWHTVETMCRDAYFRATLASSQGNVSEAARRLGVHRNTVWRELKGK